MDYGYQIRVLEPVRLLPNSDKLAWFHYRINSPQTKLFLRDFLGQIKPIQT
jgi:hypothetical protein